MRVLRTGTVAAALLAVVGSVGLAVLPAQAAGLVVTTTADETTNAETCSLREAITAANTDTATGGCEAGVGADTITFDLGGTTASPAVVALGSALSPLTTQVVLDGGGVVTIDAQASEATPRSALVVASTGVVTVQGLTLTVVPAWVGGSSVRVC